MVPNLVTFIEQYRNTVNGLVIFTKTVPWKKEYLTDNINELYTDRRTVYYSKDTTGFAEEFYQVKPLDGDIIITKNQYDVFATTDLDKILKNKGIKYLIIAGVFGDGCVLASVLGGFSKGYNFVILKDLIETTDVQLRQELQTKLKEYTWPIMYGKTLDSEEFLKSWVSKLW